MRVVDIHPGVQEQAIVLTVDGRVGMPQYGCSLSPFGMAVEERQVGSFRVARAQTARAGCVIGNVQTGVSKQVAAKTVCERTRNRVGEHHVLGRILDAEGREGKIMSPHPLALG